MINLSIDLVQKIDADFSAKRDDKLPLHPRNDGKILDDASIVSELDDLLQKALSENEMFQAICARTNYYYIAGPFPFLKNLVQNKPDAGGFIDTKENALHIVRSVGELQSKTSIDPKDLIASSSARLIVGLYKDPTKGIYQW